jgi:hypothetical protein
MNRSVPIYPEEICLSPDGSKLFINRVPDPDSYGEYDDREYDPIIDVLHVNDGTHVQTIRVGEMGIVHGVCTSRDGREIFVIYYGRNDTTIKVFNTSNGIPDRTINCHRMARAICVSSDEIFYYAEERIFVHNLTDGTINRTIDMRFEPNISLCISENDDLFVACNRDIMVMDLDGTHFHTITVDENLLPLRIHTSQNEIFALCRDVDDDYITHILQFRIDGDRINTRTVVIIDHIEKDGLLNGGVPYSICVSPNRELFISYPDSDLIKVVQV